MQSSSPLRLPATRTFRVRAESRALGPGLAGLLLAGVLAASGGLATLAGVPGLTAAGAPAAADAAPSIRVTELRRVALDPPGADSALLDHGDRPAEDAAGSPETTGELGDSSLASTEVSDASGAGPASASGLPAAAEGPDASTP